MSGLDNIVNNIVKHTKKKIKDHLAAEVLLLMGAALAVNFYVKSPRNTLLDNVKYENSYLIAKEEAKKWEDEITAHPEISRWIEIFQVSEKKRLIFNKNTIEIKDTINNEPKDLLVYQNNHKKHSYPRYTSKGLKDFAIASSVRFSKYYNILMKPFRREGLDTNLAYIFVVETGVQALSSTAHAEGFGQLLKSEKGSLQVDDFQDERNSLPLSVERTVEILKGNIAAFQSPWLAATAYIGGKFGTADGLEKMFASQNIVLKNRSSRIFSNYSDIVLFHQTNDMKIYTFDKAVPKLQKYKPQLWEIALKKSDNDVEKAKKILYSDYISDIKYKENDPVLRDADYSNYVMSFNDYYGIEDSKDDNMKDLNDGLYWKYHDYLVQNGRFYTANYALEIKSFKRIFTEQENYGINIKYQQPIDLDSLIVLKTDSLAKLIDLDDTNNVIMNLQLNDLYYAYKNKNQNTQNIIVPAGTRIFTVQN